MLNDTDMSMAPAGRRQRRSRETGEKIFRAALRLFAERGFNATTIEAIAREADVGKGTFFNYFANKESLLLQFRELQMGRVRTFVAENLEAAEPLATLLLRLALTMTAEQQRSPALFQSLMTAIFASDTVRPQMAAGLEQSRAMLGELIARRQQTGAIRRDIPAGEIAHAFQRLIFGTMMIWSLAPVAPLEEQLQQMVAIFVAGIGGAAVSS